VDTALRKLETHRERAMQRLQHEAIWGSQNNESSDTDVFQAIPGLRVAWRDADFRVYAVRILHAERSKRLREWTDTMKSIRAKGDPLSIILRFSDRSFEKTIRDNFDKHWDLAMQELQGKMYDREGRFESLMSGKKPKEELYMVRKNARHLDEDARNDSDIHYSTTAGKKTWVEQVLALKRRQDFEHLAAGNNLRLAISSDITARERRRRKQTMQRSLSVSSLDLNDPSDREIKRLFDFKKVHHLDRPRTEAELAEFHASLDNSTTSTREASHGKLKYVHQNVKKPPHGWRAHQIERVKAMVSGELFKHESGIVPFRPPRIAHRQVLPGEF